MSAAPAPGACGPSFSLNSKLLASTMVGGLLAGLWAVRDSLRLAELPADATLFLGVTAAMVLGSYLSMLRSTTCITETEISQGWLWRKSVPLNDLSQVKLLRWKPLDAVMAPRLVARTRGHGSVTFHMADPEVLRLVGLLVHGPAGK